MKQIVVKVPDKLHRAVKMKVAEKGTTITRVVIELLKDWIDDDDRDSGRNDNDMGR